MLLERWKNHLLEGDIPGNPGIYLYFLANDNEWAKAQKNFAEGEDEPWEIDEGTYWVYMKFEQAKDAARRAWTEVISKLMTKNVVFDGPKT